MDRKSFTLLELLLVVGIVGVISAFAIPGYLGVRRRAEGRQASTQVRLMHTAEKIEYLENYSYVTCSGYAACNTALDIDLPNDGWAYSVTGSFTASAAKSGCTYTMAAGASKPSQSGCTYIP